MSDKMREAFETAIVQVAEKRQYRYMDSVLERDTLGDYATTWVDSAWIGYQIALTQQPESEPAAHVFADDLKKLQTSECAVTAYSVAMVDPDRGETVALHLGAQPSAQVPRGWRITKEGGGIRIDTPSDNHCILERLEGAPGYLPINMLYDLCEAMLAAPSIADKRELSQACQDVIAERQRQVDAEDWTPEHDDQHEIGQMARAAVCYADPLNEGRESMPLKWPWAEEWWKPKDRRRNLVRAAALLVAEIERMDRAALQRPEPQEEQS